MVMGLMKGIGAAFIAVALFSCTSQEEVFLKKARELVAQDDFSGAQAFLQEGVEKTPNNLEAVYLYGWVLLSVGKNEEALVQFARCRNLDAKFYGGYKGFGALYIGKKDYANAEREFKLALEKSPKSPEILANLAETKFLQGDLQSATAYLEQAARLDVRHGDYPILLAEMYWRAKNMKDSKAALEKGRRKRIWRKAIRAKADCLEGVLLEGEATEGGEKSSGSFGGAERKKLEKALSLIDRCEKESPKRFQFQAERARIAALLAPSGAER